jgi:hypothetical protein
VARAGVYDSDQDRVEHLSLFVTGEGKGETKKPDF